MIPESELRLKIWHERNMLRRQDLRGNEWYVQGMMSGLTLAEKLLRDAVKESRESKRLWPKRVRWYMAGELYLAMKAAFDAFKRGDRQRGLKRLQSTLVRYQGVEVRTTKEIVNA